MNRQASETTSLERVLIANRGEIAIRIAKAAAGLGMESVGVYATVDSLSLHTRFTTLSAEIGGGAAIGAYLDGPALVQAAVRHGCDCVHPGYGFLAENAAFAELCAAAGLVFIGPLPAALELFGDKVKARAFAESIGVPVVPGSARPVVSAEEAIAIARDLGYPMMLKASAGGGGRGMRRVERSTEMPEGLFRSSLLEFFGVPFAVPSEVSNFPRVPIWSSILLPSCVYFWTMASAFPAIQILFS